MSDTNATKPTTKKTLSKPQAVTLMVIGAILFVFSILIPTAQGTTAEYVKIAVGIIGFIVLCLGAYLRPMNKTATKE